MMALQLQAPAPERTTRFQEILKSSRLPPELKAYMSTTLAVKEAQSLTVHRALIDALGVDNEDVRGEIWSCLHQCWTGLEQGKSTADERHWILADGQYVPMSESADKVNLTDRSETLVGDMVSHMAGESLQATSAAHGGVSVALLGLCRALYLAVQFDEEEEEEEWIGPELDG